MNNCFVTKITDSIQNDATHNPMLHKINEFVVKVKPLMTGMISIPTFRSSKVVVKINVLGGETLNIPTSSIDRYQDYTVNSLDDLYLKVSDVDSVDYIVYSQGGSPNGIAFDISGFATFDNLKDLRLYGKNITGDISNIANLVNLTNLAVSNSNITGDISNIANLVNLTNLDVSNSNITGDIKALAKLTKAVEISISSCTISGTIESLANEIAKANIAHVLKIWTLGSAENKCTITYNGNKAVKRVWTITFAADGTYTVENTDS